MQRGDCVGRAWLPQGNVVHRAAPAENTDSTLPPAREHRQTLRHVAAVGDLKNVSSEGVGALLVDNCGGFRLVFGTRRSPARPPAHLAVHLIAFVRFPGGIAGVIVVAVALSFLQFAVAAAFLFRIMEDPSLERMDRTGNMAKPGA